MALATVMSPATDDSSTSRLSERGKILVVDDEPVNLMIIEKILRAGGFDNIDTVQDPTLVPDMYREQDYDLVALDIHMPQCSGFEVMERMQADFPDDYLPLIVLTADCSEDTHLRCLASGAKDFISKPFRKDEVLLRVKNLLEVRLLHKKLQRQKAELEVKVLQRTEQLYQTQLKLIDCLASAARYREASRRASSGLLGQYVFILSRELALPAEECELLQQACQMHDLGKIAVPDEILMKKRRLTKADREAIELHAIEGEKILSGHNSELLKTAATIARSHHENWDGTGYPDRLAGEDIPMNARVVSVCHVFDALTSDRPYRKAWNVNKAVTFILEQSGYKFDPRIVAAFEQVIDQIVMCWQAEHTAANNNHSIN